MIGIDLIRENPEVVRESQGRRGKDPKIVDKAIRLDKEWREVIQKLNNLRHERNLVTSKIAKLKEKEKSAKEEIKQMRALKKEISELEAKTEELKQKRDQVLWNIPNILHESVPKGKDESENVPIRYWGEKPKFKFKPKDQIELLRDLDLADFKRAAKISGSRAYFLKGKLVKLELDTLRFALDFLETEGFTVFRTPHLLKKRAMECAVDFGTFQEDLYKIQGEDKYLIATAEDPFTALHMNEVLLEDTLPRKYAGFSACFRKEAGTRGRFSKGLYRLHEFLKIEQYILCRPENSWKLHEYLIGNAEQLMKRLKIPYRVVNICTGDMGTIASKKYDIEAWMPGSGRYGEVVSCSNCLDYQARRANIRYRETKGKRPKGFVHTLNSSAVATPRLLISMIENYQQSNGSIKVPKALWPYLDFKIIGKNNE